MRLFFIAGVFPESPRRPILPGFDAPCHDYFVLRVCAGCDDLCPPLDTSASKVLKEATGEDISTRAMMDYFKPLMSWLEEQNKGRQIGWD